MSDKQINTRTMTAEEYAAHKGAILGPPKPQPTGLPGLVDARTLSNADYQAEKAKITRR